MHHKYIANYWYSLVVALHCTCDCNQQKIIFGCHIICKKHKHFPHTLFMVQHYYLEHFLPMNWSLSLMC